MHAYMRAWCTHGHGQARRRCAEAEAQQASAAPHRTSPQHGLPACDVPAPAPDRVQAAAAWQAPAAPTPAELPGLAGMSAITELGGWPQPPKAFMHSARSNVRLALPASQLARSSWIAPGNASDAGATHAADAQPALSLPVLVRSARVVRTDGAAVQGAPSAAWTVEGHRLSIGTCGCAPPGLRKALGAAATWRDTWHVRSLDAVS